MQYLEQSDDFLQILVMRELEALFQWPKKNFLSEILNNQLLQSIS